MSYPPMCESCKFWDSGIEGDGTCHRHPPVVIGPVRAIHTRTEPRFEMDRLEDSTYFPAAHKYSWCGEHRTIGT